MGAGGSKDGGSGSLPTENLNKTDNRVDNGKSDTEVHAPKKETESVVSVEGADFEEKTFHRPPPKSILRNSGGQDKSTPKHQSVRRFSGARLERQLAEENDDDDLAPKDPMARPNAVGRIASHGRRIAHNKNPGDSPGNNNEDLAISGSDSSPVVPIGTLPPPPHHQPLLKTKSAVRVLVTDCSVDDVTSIPALNLDDGNDGDDDDDESELKSSGDRRNGEEDDADDEAFNSLVRVDSSEEIMRRRRFKARRFPPSAASLSSSIGSSSELDLIGLPSRDASSTDNVRNNNNGNGDTAFKLSPQTPRRSLLSPQSVVDDGTSSDDGGDVDNLLGDFSARKQRQQLQQQQKRLSKRQQQPPSDKKESLAKADAENDGVDLPSGSAGGAIKWVPKDRSDSSRRQRRFSSTSVDDDVVGGGCGVKKSGSTAEMPAASTHGGGHHRRGAGIRAIQAMRKEFRVKSPSDSDSDLLLASSGATIADPTFVAKHILLSRSHDKLHNLQTATTTMGASSNDDWSSDAASPRRASSTPRDRKKGVATEFHLEGAALTTAPTTPRGLAPLAAAPAAITSIRRRGEVDDPFVGKPLGRGGGRGGSGSVAPTSRSVTAKRRESLFGTGLWEANADARGRRGGKDWSTEQRIGSGLEGRAMEEDEEEEEEEDPFKTKAERLRELVRLSFDPDKFKQANSTGYVGSGVSPRSNKLDDIYKTTTYGTRYGSSLIKRNPIGATYGKPDI